MSFRSESLDNCKKKKPHKGSPLRRNHPGSLGHHKHLISKNQIFMSTPNMKRGTKEAKKFVKVRRVMSESQCFMHSWDYSPIVVPSGKRKNPQIS